MNTPSDLKYTKEHEWVKEESAGVVPDGSSAGPGAG
jgi:glycine cleavage system H lipoate-binding protein